MFGSATEGIYLRTRSDQSSSTSQTNSNVQLECLREVMGQDVDSPPSISISDYELDGVHDFLYLGSTISDSLALNMEINKRIGKAATTMSSITKRVWTNGKLTEHTKIQVYRACDHSTLLYGNEVWPLRARRALAGACGTYEGRQDSQLRISSSTVS